MTDNTITLAKEDPEKANIVLLFKNLVLNDMAIPVAAMNSLVLKLKLSKAATWMELEQELSSLILELKNCTDDDLSGRSRISITSGCDLFMKYVTRSFNLEYNVIKYLNIYYKH